MANVIIFDVVTGDVLQVLYSAHTPDYENQPNCLINPNIPANTPLRHLEVIEGAVVFKSQLERDAADAALLPTYIQKRERDYRRMDPHQMEALCKMANELKKAGIVIGDPMEAILTARQDIKDRFPGNETMTPTWWSNFLNWFRGG